VHDLESGVLLHNHRNLFEFCFGFQFSIVDPSQILQHLRIYRRARSLWYTIVGT
jgi:hypothetical protein